MVKREEFKTYQTNPDPCTSILSCEEADWAPGIRCVQKRAEWCNPASTKARKLGCYLAAFYVAIPGSEEATLCRGISYFIFHIRAPALSCHETTHHFSSNATCRDNDSMPIRPAYKKCLSGRGLQPHHHETSVYHSQSLGSEHFLLEPQEVQTPCNPARCAVSPP
jgi:hypothetical protein